MRRNLLEFDTRIVETATIVKAVQDNRLPAPGMAAIMDLHFQLMDAAALNPNPWVVHRQQVVLCVPLHFLCGPFVVFALTPNISGLLSLSSSP